MSHTSDADGRVLVCRHQQQERPSFQSLGTQFSKMNKEGAKIDVVSMTKFINASDGIKIKYIQSSIIKGFSYKKLMFWLLSGL